jgi:hypothetical protein
MLTILDAVARLGGATPAQLAHVISEYGAKVSVAGVRRRCVAMVRGRLTDLRRLELGVAGPIEIVTLTRSGVRALASELAARGRPSAQPWAAPAITQAMHHLWAVEAALQIADDAGGRLVALAGDTGERRAGRAGRRTGLGDRLGMIPDARATIGVDGRELESLIEILTPKYSDQQLLAKVAGLPIQTRYFATAASVADRCDRLGFSRLPVLTGWSLR